VKDDSPQLTIIEQLSREYDEKYKDLEKLVSESSTEDIASQIMALSERAAERFRSAQATLLCMPGIFKEDRDKKLLPAMTTLFRSFDEMRILLHFLFDSELSKKIMSE
jgi:hypothetical protein